MPTSNKETENCIAYFDALQKTFAEYVAFLKSQKSNPHEYNLSKGGLSLVEDVARDYFFTKRKSDMKIYAVLNFVEALQAAPDNLEKAVVARMRSHSAFKPAEKAQEFFKLVKTNPGYFKEVSRKWDQSKADSIATLFTGNPMFDVHDQSMHAKKDRLHSRRGSDAR